MQPAEQRMRKHNAVKVNLGKRNNGVFKMHLIEESFKVTGL